jgi:hypothetical protein
MAFTLKIYETFRVVPFKVCKGAIWEITGGAALNTLGLI